MKTADGLLPSGKQRKYDGARLRLRGRCAPEISRLVHLPVLGCVAGGVRYLLCERHRCRFLLFLLL